MMWDLFNEPFDIRPDGMVHAPGRGDRTAKAAFAPVLSR